MKYWSLYLLLGLWLAGCGALRPSPITDFELQTPRPFGYLIGDEIRHRIVIETRHDLRLVEDSLPKQGPINRWLNLQQIRVETDPDHGHTVIDLLYQVFYAANEVKMLAVPGFTLRFNQNGNSVEQTVPQWHFTLSPIQELAIRKDENGLNYLRPDAIPLAQSTQQQWLLVYASLGLAMLISLYLSYLYGYFPIWPRQRIFKRALHELGQLTQHDLPRGLAVMHHAFNLLNQQPLFRHQLSGFYQIHPEYRSIAPQIDWFFLLSNQILFAGKQDFVDDDWGRLQALCRDCRAIECGRR